MINSQRFFVFFLFLAIVLSGCKSKTIPEKDMVKILAEVFITDAVVASSRNSFEFSKRDSIEYYAPIYSKMGYTDKQFMATMSYFFNNPEVFDSVLDKVVNRLSVMEAELEASIAKEIVKPITVNVDSLNLWKQKTTWAFPADSDQDSLYFKIPIEEPGTYTLSALVKVLPNDESIEPRSSIWLTRDSTGVRDNIKMEQYTRNGKAIDITLSLSVTDSTYTHIEGFVLGHIPQYGDWKKFAEVSDIEITYSPVLPKIELRDSRILFRDSLRVMDRKIESISPR
ncbi:MAG: DUF4296 domain-containing protein [Bacteroidales bacterium]|nr:DUF4296 domain-containing protein [Tenuifilaceae bacterium]